MRLVMFSWYYPPIVGGLENIARHLAHALSANGHDVCVLTSAQPDGVPTIEAGGNGDPQVVRLKMLDPNAEDVAGNELVGQLEQHFGFARCDVLYGHLLTYPWAPRRSAGLIEFFRQRGAKVVEQAQGGRWERNPREAIRLLNLVDGIICDSEYISDSLRAFLDGARSEVEDYQTCHPDFRIPEPYVIYPSIVSASQFRPDLQSRRQMRDHLAIGQDEFVVLFPSRFFDIDGSLSTAKRAAVAVEAFARFARHSDLPVRLVAPSPPGFGSAKAEQATRAELADMLRSLQIEDCVLFLNERIPHDQMHVYYQLADMCLVPSVEAFGLVYLESMATGVPVVAVAKGASTEVLGTEGGLLVDKPDDVAALARAIGALAESPSLRESIKESARQRALTHFTPMRLLQETEQFLATLLDPRGTRRPPGGTRDVDRDRRR